MLGFEEFGVDVFGSYEILAYDEDFGGDISVKT